MTLIKAINYVRISLLINHLNVVFSVLYDITFWMFAQSIATCFRREIKQIKANEANDVFESP
jgi:hypothetical protein